MDTNYYNSKENIYKSEFFQYRIPVLASASFHYELTSFASDLHDYNIYQMFTHSQDISYPNSLSHINSIPASKTFPVADILNSEIFTQELHFTFNTSNKTNSNKTSNGEAWK